MIVPHLPDPPPPPLPPPFLTYNTCRDLPGKQCLSVMVKVGPPSMGGGGGGGSGSSTNKCPLCRVGFTQADVVGGAELEQAGGNAIANAKEQERAGKDGGVGLASASAAAAAAVVAGVEGKGARVPPPKVAALLQR